VGNHGLELDDEAAGFAARIAAFKDSVELPVEDKGLSLSYHYRGAEDEDAVHAELEQVAEYARMEGLDPRWGRKVLELRPTADVDKGTAVRRLLDRPGLSLALFAGDDRTDLDAIHALRSLVEGGALRGAVCIGIASDEAPAGLAEEVDALLSSPEDLVEVLRMLTSASVAQGRGTAG